jgi:muramoyltetrapeptide carboxypeptidase LdcA involved in peptidoglycan recycling
LDIATIYGSNFGSFGEENFYKCHYDFLDTIKGDLKELTSYDLYEEERAEKVTGLEGLNLTKKVKWKSLDNKDVKVEGRIIGGCFDLISELIGTKYDGIPEFNKKYKDDGIIWYFDNCELSMEETIRVLWKMKECDYFKYAKAVIFGRFGIETSYTYSSVKECLKDSILNELNIPIIYDADVSHKGPSIPIINGSIANIKLSNNKATIKYELK